MVCCNKIDSKSKYLGSFVNEWEAAKAYNNAVDKYWDGQGYKNHKNQNDSIFEYEYKTYKDQKRRRRGKSKFKGVYLTQSGYVAQITYKRKTYHIGWSKIFMRLLSCLIKLIFIYMVQK